MQFPKAVFNLCNSLAFVSLGLLLEECAAKLYPSLRKTTLSLSAIFLGLWWFLPEFGKTILWASGSGNYLWTSLFYLSFIYVFLLLHSKAASFLLLPLGFLAGATNENVAPAIIASFGLYLLYKLYSPKKNSLFFTGSP